MSLLMKTRRFEYDPDPHFLKVSHISGEAISG